MGDSFVAPSDDGSGKLTRSRSQAGWEVRFLYVSNHQICRNRVHCDFRSCIKMMKSDQLDVPRHFEVTFVIFWNGIVNELPNSSVLRAVIFVRRSRLLVDWRAWGIWQCIGAGLWCGRMLQATLRVWIRGSCGYGRNQTA